VNNLGQPGAESGHSDPTIQQRKEILFYALAVIFMTTLIVACFRLLHITNNWVENALMFIPGLMAVVFRIYYRAGFRSVGWRRGPLTYWLWAAVLPVIALLISLPISIRLGYAALAPASNAIGRLASNPLKLVETMLIYIAISIPFAFAEEFGWRGYAQGKLVRAFGLVSGLLLLGIIWGFWHTPIYYFMRAFPNHPILGPFVMTPIDNILAVIPMGWLYIRSRNIWVPTLAHAFADVLWGFSGLMFPATHEVQSWALLQAAQLIVSIVLLIDLTSRPGHELETSAAPLPATQ
jgi:membrane protease YdiL (CAAX protease family)